jgi:hypothetical protein
METAITTILVAFITAVLGPSVLEWVKAKLNKTEKPSNPVDEAIEMNTLIDDQLDGLLEEMQADRVWIAQFHNGGHFYPTGKSIQKFSIFYEKLAYDVKSLQHTFQNIPVSLFPKVMAELYKTGELSIATFEEGKDYDLEPFSKPFGTKSIYMIALSDLHDRFIGVLTISYNEEYKFNKEDWIFIRQKAGVIGTLLDEYLNKKK